MAEGIIGNVGQAVKSPYQAIISVEGELSPLERVANRFTLKEGETPKFKQKDQAQITLVDAVILEMEPGVPAPDLKDDQYRTWLGYAETGAQPGEQSLFVRGFLKTANQLDAQRKGLNYDEMSKDERIEQLALKHLYGTRVQIRHIEVAYTFKDKVTGEVDKKKYPTIGLFDAEETDPTDVSTIALDKIVGLNPKAALREFTLDARLKRFPEYGAALKAGTVEKLLPVELVEGVFVKREGDGAS